MLSSTTHVDMSKVCITLSRNRLWKHPVDTPSLLLSKVPGHCVLPGQRPHFCSEGKFSQATQQVTEQRKNPIWLTWHGIQPRARLEEVTAEKAPEPHSARTPPPGRSPCLKRRLAQYHPNTHCVFQRFHLRSSSFHLESTPSCPFCPSGRHLLCFVAELGTS